jgi:integrase
MAAAPITVQEIIDAYLELGTDELAEATRENSVRTLNRFAADFGTRLVAELKTIDLQRWLKEQPEWKSGWTIQRVQAVVKRAFNFGIEMDLIAINPFARFRNKRGIKRRRQPMEDRHFQTLLRFSEPNFRRFLIFLKLTGCRPKEASTMRWRNVHFDKQAVILEEHKTAHSTGRARIIPLVPTLIKLLVWMREHRQVSTVGLVERFLLAAGGRIKSVELIRLIRPYGVSDRAIARARAALGVRKERVNGTGPDGWYEYVLPDDHEPWPDPKDHDFVFVGCLGNPWNRRSLGVKVMRIRQRAGLPKGVSLYQLRHRFGFTGIKNRVNLKLLSLAMGHSRTTTTELYLNGDLSEDVREAALQINYGPGAVAAIRPPPRPRPIVMMEPAQVQEIQAVAEYLPTRNGNTRPRPRVPIDPPAPPEPVPVDAKKLDTVLDRLLHKLGAPESKKSNKPAPIPKRLTPAQEEAWKAYRWAIEQNPELTNATDTRVFEWLRGNAGNYCLSPLADTFGRYLRVARLFFDCRKRVLRGREPLPEQPDEGEDSCV